MKTNRCLIICIILFLFSNKTEAQQTEMSDMHILVSHMISNPSGYDIQETAKDILKENKDNYSFEEYYVMGIAALKSEEEESRHELGSIAVQGMEPLVLSNMRIMQDASIEERKENIISWLDYYSDIVLLFSQFQDQARQLDYNQIVLFFHQYVYKNRDKMFDKNVTEDILKLLRIIVADSYFCEVSDDYETLFKNYIQEFMDLSQKLPGYCNFIVYSIFKGFNPFVLKNEIIYNRDIHLLRLLGEKDTQSLSEYYSYMVYHDPYVEDRANYFIQLKELELQSIGGSLRFSEDKTYYNGSSESLNLNNIGWKNIQESLKSNECALLLHNSLLISSQKKPIVEGVLIIPNDFKPIDLFSIDVNSLIDGIFKKYPRIDRVYVCPNEEFENIDIAYCDARVFLKYSLMDILANNDAVYNNGEICVFADINYGIGENGSKQYWELPTDKALVSELEKSFGNKMYSLTGDNVKKINFLNTTNRFDIIHVSTHGDISILDKTPHDAMEFYSSVLGYTNMSGYVLALSNYNENKNENSVSAEEIRRMDFSGVDLVYLDACETSNVGTSFWGTYSIAKAFYLGGASKVIGYLKKINPNISLDFALSFYKELTISDKVSYHDAFYKAKKQIIEKYRNILEKDSLGRPNINIVLWE